MNFDIQKYLPEPVWRKSLAILSLFIFLLLALYHETANSVLQIWINSDTFAHGLLIIPFSLYMIWTNRKQLSGLQPEYSYLGLVILLPTLVVWLLASAIDVLVVQQLALLVMVWALILSILGPRVFFANLFPLLFLFFAIPLGEGLIPVLMDLTAYFTVKLLSLTGFPVYREGLFFAIPSGNFEVAKACSGIRYLFASVALGSLFAYINFRSLWKRSAFIAVSFVLPVVANILRAYGIVLIAHYSGMEYAVGVDHLVYGWLFFGIIIFLMFFIGSRWREDENTNQKKSLYKNVRTAPFSKSVIVSSLILAFVSSGVVAKSWLSPSINKDEIQSLTSIAPPAGWVIHTQDQKVWSPEFKGASSRILSTFEKNAVKMRLFMAHYRSESQGEELINQNNRFYDTNGWVQVNSRHRRMALGDDKNLNYKELILKNGERRKAIRFWYDINGYTTDSVYLGKLVQAVTRILRTDKGGVVVILLTEYAEDDVEVLDRFDHFHQSIYPLLQTSIAHARG